MKKIFITLLLLLTVVCSINLSTVATYADTPDDNQEVISYTETVYPRSGAYSGLKAGEITVGLTQEGFKESTGVIIMTGTKINITTAPGYVIKSVTLTSADTNNLILGATPDLQSTKDSDKVWTLTGFEPGQNYQIHNLSTAYKLYSVTVTYENHIHTEFNRTGDKNSHWDGCVCLYKLNEEPHSWDEGTVTKEPTHTSKGEKKYTCPDCDVVKTEAVSPSLTDAKVNITLSGVLTYNGEAQTQGVVVTYGGQVLKENVNYTVRNNVNTEVGDYRLTVKGNGMLTGTVEIEYSIGKGTYDMSGVTFADATVTYDGNAHPLAILGDLPAGVTVTYENNDQVNAGTHTVVAKFTGDTDKYNAIPDMTATLTVEKATYDMSGVTFAGATVTYDGNAHPLAILGDLPAGVTVTYENNDQVNAGTHTVVAKFTGSDNYNAIPDMTATLTVEKATYDMSGVVFADKAVTYNGSAFSIEATNLPTGVTVTYDNNGKTSVGTYTVVAKFTGSDNYNTIPDMEATLTVNKATYDMSGVVFADKAVTYNGSAFSIEATNLPTGVTVTYENNGKTSVGTYTVVAKFTGDADNYNAIPDMEATLTVNKATYDMSGVTFGDKTVTYNGSAFSIEATNLPTGVTVTYENNGKTSVGTYTVVAKFTGDADNYNVIPDMEATLTVNKATYDMSGVVFADKTVTYNGSAFSIEATNLPTGVTVTYENNGKTSAGTYTVVAKFTGDADNYNAIPDMEATLTVNKATYDMSGVTFADATVTYDGNAHSLAILGDLPAGVTVTYENNGKTSAGAYTVVAKFTGDADNYNVIPDMEATLTVNKATYDMSGVVFADKAVTYNGSAFSLVATNLPDGVTVSYENNGKTEPGKYTVTAKFTGSSNYNAIPDMTATLTVKQSSFTFLTDAENAEDEIENDFFVSCETGVDPDANLIVEMIETKTSTEDLEQFLEKNQRIGVAYDVKLLKDGATVQPDGTLQFKVLIPADLRGKDFEIMHIHAGSEKNILSYTIDGDYVIFETDKLSEFVFVYETGSLVWLVIVLACLALAEAGALVFLMNKNDKVKRVKLGAAYPPFLFGMFIPGWQIVCVAALAAVVVGLAAVDVIYALKLVNNTTSAVDEGAVEE